VENYHAHDWYQMSDSTDQAAIAAAIAKPSSISADGVSVSNRPTADLIAGINYQRAISATAPLNVAATLRGMCFKIVPPGGP
jgi:hypothetical protein